MLLLVTMYMKKHCRRSRQTKFKSVRELFVFWPRVTIMHLRYDFAFVLHENALVFSQSEAHNFFMYIINKVIYL